MVSAGYGDAASSVPGPHPPSSVGGFTPHSYGGGPTLPSSTFNVTAFQNSVRHRKITPASAPQSRGEYVYTSNPDPVNQNVPALGGEDSISSKHSV